MLQEYQIVNKTANENMYSRIKFKKQEKQDLGDFFALYEKYLNALSCNLVFAKCASKLTRVDKLYSKELVFTTTNKTNVKDKISWEIKTLMHDSQKYANTKKTNQSTSTYKTLSIPQKRLNRNKNTDAK